jgi:hypothetical protein
VDSRPFELIARLSDKIHFLSLDGCWLWTGQRTTWGYGVVVGMIAQTKTSAHRAMWEVLVGPIPDGLVLDHICRNRLCVNPTHLQVTSHGNNAALGQRRKTRCPQGHPYDEENTQWTLEGYRHCRACNRERTMQAFLKRKARTDVARIARGLKPYRSKHVEE